MRWPDAITLIGSRLLPETREIATKVAMSLEEKRGRKKTSLARLKSPPLSPLPAFWNKVARAHGLTQADIARLGNLEATFVNTVFQGRRMSPKAMRKIADAIGLSFRQHEEMKRVWTAVKWKEPVSKTKSIKPKSYSDRLEDLEKKFKSAMTGLRKAEGYLREKREADHVAAMITSITATALPAVNEATELINTIQNELAVLREKLVRRMHDLEHPPAKVADEPTDDGSIPYDGELI